MPGLGARLSRHPTLLLLLLGLAAVSAAGRSADSSSPASSSEEQDDGKQHHHNHHQGGGGNSQEHQHRHQRYRHQQRDGGGGGVGGGGGGRSHHHSHRATEFGMLPFPADLAGGGGGGGGGMVAGDVRPRGNSSSRGEMMCEEAKMKCAYREGCGEALQRFVAACSEIAIGTRIGAHARDEEMPTCSEPCQHALIALTSTEEGQALITCRCSDESCESAKKRASACAPAVAAASQPDAVLPCRVAQLVCSADPQCSTALGYYERLCRAAFSGRKCTPKCRNSATILRRQPKAAGLSSCRCDGREDYDCDLVRRNTERLCFRRTSPPTPPSPPVPPIAGGDIPLIPEEEGKRPGSAVGDTNTNEIVRISGALAGGRNGGQRCAATTATTAAAVFIAQTLLAYVLSVRASAWNINLPYGLAS